MAEEASAVLVEVSLEVVEASLVVLADALPWSAVSDETFAHTRH